MNIAPFSIRSQAKRGIVRQVRALFNDQVRGERPVQRSGEALFTSNSAIWRVHGDVTSMMVGGVSALLLQMLHPAVLAGVWDHSNFRADMVGRLRRTARFIAITTYGNRAAAESAIARVRGVHDLIGGTLPDGSVYNANDPRLLAWVHTTEAWCFLAAWQRYGSRPLSTAEQDSYFADFSIIGEALGADRLPKTRASTDQALEEMRPKLAPDDRTREVARLVLGYMPDNPFAIPLQRITMQAAINLLPEWARQLHSLSASPSFARPLITTGTLSLAKTLRWAFASS